MKFFGNDSGFSLVQGMILSAILSGGALVTTKVLTDQKMAVKGAETRDQIEELHTLIFSILQNKDHCHATYVSNLGPTLAVPIVHGSSVTLNNISTREVANLFEAYNSADYVPSRIYMNGNIVISGMTLQHSNLDNPSQLRVNYRRLESNSVKRTKLGYGSKDITKIIPITIQHTANVYEGCYASEIGQNHELSKSFCTDLGEFFLWNEVRNTCEPRDNTCPSGQIFVGMSSTGAPICKTIENWSDLGDFVRTAPHASCNDYLTRPNVRFVITGGKAQLRCN